MRLALDPRAGRLLRRVPRTNPYTVLELVLLSLLALQCARLFWVLLTPVGPVGDWRAASTRLSGAPTGVLGSFDPFFRLSGAAGPAVVTSMNLKLFGIRQDQASGRGSAIIATPDGQQRSFAVGEEIAPGVTLTAVGFDNVILSRGGQAEQLFMDQSPPAQTVAGAPTAPAAPAAPPSAVVVSPLPPPVSPPSNADPLASLGLAPGDVVSTINGQRVGSTEQARTIAREMSGRTVTVQVERNGRMVALRGRVGQ
jgi:general secretion pathway protein C